MTTTSSSPRSNRGSFAAMYEASRQMSMDASPRSLKLEQLVPNPDQPRNRFHQETLEELASSIKTYGLLQPLVVRPHPDGDRAKYQIVAGERRFHACKLAGLEAVPVVIKSMDDAEVRQVALIENLQRENITPLEEAQVLKQILDETGLSHRDLGERIGKTKAYVEQRVRLLRYPSEVQSALSQAPAQEAAFTPGHAKAVVQVEDADTRRSLIQLIEAGALSVREAERRVHQLKRVSADVPQLERREKLLADILRPDGLSDAAIESAVSAPGRRAGARTGASEVDLETLSVIQLLLEAQATGHWKVGADTLRKALKSDMAKLK